MKVRAPRSALLGFILSALCACGGPPPEAEEAGGPAPAAQPASPATSDPAASRPGGAQPEGPGTERTERRFCQSSYNACLNACYGDGWCVRYCWTRYNSCLSACAGDSWC